MDNNGKSMDRRIKQGILASKLTARKLSIEDRDGKSIDINDCYINTSEIMGLEEYLREKGELTERNIDTEKIKDRYVIPIILLDGRKIEIEVRDLQVGIKPELAIIYDTDRNVECTKPIILEEVNEYISNKTGNAISSDIIREIFEPKNMADLAEKISEDRYFLPTEPKDVAKMLEIKAIDSLKKSEDNVVEEDGEDRNNPERVIYKEEKSQEEDPEQERNTVPNNKPVYNESKEDKKEDDSKDVPEDISEEVKNDVKIILGKDEELRKNGCRLKQVLKVDDGKSVADMIQSEDYADDNGIKNNAPLTIYRFASGGVDLSDRVVILQEDRVISVGERDGKTISKKMDDIGSPEISYLKDNETQYMYTDLDGHKFVGDLSRNPNDLSDVKKDEILAEMDKLDKESFSILSSSMSDEEKTKSLQICNNKRLELIKENGLALPIEGEIRADNEILEDMSEDIQADSSEVEKPNGVGLDDGVGPDDEGSDDRFPTHTLPWEKYA